MEQFGQFSARRYANPLDSADARTEWLEQLQLQLGGVFTWATNESEEGFSINNERFIISGLLGDGSFGSVYRCSCEGHQMAVKFLSTERIAMMTNCSQDIVLRRMLQEPEIMGCLGGHPNIVQLRCAAISQETLRIYIVMQLLECSDLFTEMLRRRQSFNERDAREAVSQLVMAVVHCHRRGVAHRDIKLENVMVASLKPFVIKLIDFGQAVIHDNRTEHMRSSAKTLTTTSVYTPPEVKAQTAEGLNYDAFKLDSFAVGVVMYALLMSAWPQTNREGDSACGSGDSTASGRAGTHAFEKHPKWISISSPAQDLIKGLLEPDPLKRLSMADALQHPWLCQKSSSAVRSNKSPTPMDSEAEMQVLLSAQTLNKALQRECGSSCWLMSGHPEAENPCIWFRKSTDESFEHFEERLSNLPRATVDIAPQILKLREFTARLRGCCNARRNGPDEFQEIFDEVFSGYCKLNEEVINLIGSLLAAFGGAETTVTTLELKIRMLLHMAEQLGRERAFVSFYIGRPELLHSVKTQLRFAKIQGCRQYLMGSSSPYLQCEVVSTATGLLPSLRLADEPILSTSEIEALEFAENSVMQGRKDTSEWFAFLTGMIDKVHQHISMTVVLFLQDLGGAPQEIHQSVPSISSLASTEFETPSRIGSIHESNEKLSQPWTVSLVNQAILQDQASQGSQVNQAILQDQASQGSQARRHSETDKYEAILKAAAALQQQQEEYFEKLAKTNTVQNLGMTGVASNGHNLSNLAPPSFLGQKEHTPVKVMPLSLSTPEATPIHPGIWRGPNGLGHGYPISPLNLPFGLNSMPAFSQFPPQVELTPPAPPPVQENDATRQPSARSIVMSKGTFGHPHSCRRLGCKFASKERGCREGVDCPRCHLCVWSRASEKEASQGP